MREGDFERSDNHVNVLHLETTKKWVAPLAALLTRRLVFGLSSELFKEDETQIFLMGLR